MKKFVTSLAVTVTASGLFFLAQPVLAETTGITQATSSTSIEDTVTTSESQSATQPNESTESMITSDEIENTESSTQRFDPDWFQKLEERRK